MKKYLLQSAAAGLVVSLIKVQGVQHAMSFPLLPENFAFGRLNPDSLRTPHILYPHSFIVTMLTNFLVTLAVSALVVGAPSGKQALAKLYTSCTVPNTVALTFDDGPWIFARNVSDALTKAGVKGTFFYNGNNYDCIYNQARVDDIKYVYAQGHQIGSHTWSHAHLTQLSKEEVLSEMQRVDQALQRILGVLPAFFRPPYGEYNDDVLTVAEQVGESAVNWDLDSGDSETKPVDYQKGVYDDAVKRHPSTILSLEHETYDTTANEVVEYAISKLQGAGYKLVTVAECLGGLKPYRSTSAPQSRTSDWHC